MLIIAHRGASLAETENTRAAFEAAAEVGADAVETDLRGCRFCGRLALSHDAIKKKEQCENTLAFEDFLQIKIQGAYLPLSDTEMFLGEKLDLYLEIKESWLIKKVLDMTRELRFRDHIIFSSFKWLELFKFRRRNKRLRIGLLWDQNKIKIPRWFVAFCAKYLGAKSVHLQFEGLSLEDVMYFRTRGFSVYAFTVNKFEDIYLAWQWDLDGIFTDAPAYAREVLSQLSLAVIQ